MIENEKSVIRAFRDAVRAQEAVWSAIRDMELLSGYEQNGDYREVIEGFAINGADNMTDEQALIAVKKLLGDVEPEAEKPV